MYDVATGQLRSLITVPDETMIFFASADRLVTMWQAGDRLEVHEHTLDQNALIADACARVGRSLTADEWEEDFPGETRRDTCPAH